MENKNTNQNGLTFLQTTIPNWRVVVMNKALNIRFDNLEFFIQSKYGRLAISNEGNYFFSISIVKEWNYETTFNGKKTLLNGEVLFNTINEMKQRAINQFENTKNKLKEVSKMVNKLEEIEKAKEELLKSAPKIINGDK